MQAHEGDPSQHTNACKVDTESGREAYFCRHAEYGALPFKGVSAYVTVAIMKSPTTQFRKSLHSTTTFEGC